MDSPYLVIARKYRPQTFSDVIGQNAIVRTLLNALQSKRVSHAYLFSGSKGTGKTTLARLFAKALNCTNPSDSGEPCNTCASCVEITESRSLDVLEIDGASHRGIDHIRSLTEGASYAPTGGKHKIYLIDEVHMLTKEAFNALLKTLEEPPACVKFFFATTEPHKIPPTILSRCQRFNLRRLSKHDIVDKLKRIAKEMKISADETALVRLAEYADGGLRDAESLLDQLITFSDGCIHENLVEEVLGIIPSSWFVEIDLAIESADISVAYTISDRVFHEGKDVCHVIDDLTGHYRTLLHLQLGVPSDTALEAEKEQQFRQCASRLTQEHLLDIFHLLAEAQKALKTASSQRFLLEWLLINIIRIKRKISLPLIARKLFELQNQLPPESNDSQTPRQPQKVQPYVEAKPSKRAQPVKKVTQRQPSPKQTVKLEESPLQQPREDVKQTVEHEKPPPPKKQTPVIVRPEPLVDLSSQQKAAQTENLVQFAAVELGATVTKKT